MYLKKQLSIVFLGSLVLSVKAQAETALQDQGIFTDGLTEPSTIAMIGLGFMTLVLGRLTKRFHRD